MDKLKTIAKSMNPLLKKAERYDNNFIAFVLIGLVLVFDACNSPQQFSVVGELCKAKVYCNDTLMDKLYFTPLYIGKPINSLNLEELSGTRDYLVDTIEKKTNSVILNGENSLIKLDTRIQINYHLFSPFREQDKLNVCYCEGYSYKITNVSSDTLVLSGGPYVPIVVQGLDTQSRRWINLTSKLVYLDNHGLNALLLPPNNIALFSIPKFSNENYLKYRVVLNDVISQEYQ